MSCRKPITFSGKGTSIYVLSMIQSGKAGDGKYCDYKTGKYLDVETAMTLSEFASNAYEILI